MLHRHSNIFSLLSAEEEATSDGDSIPNEKALPGASSSKKSHLGVYAISQCILLTLFT